MTQRFTKVDVITEKEWQGQVEQLAHTFAWLSYHTYDSRRSSNGFPDLALVRRGRLIFAELKTEKGKASSDQDVWLGALKDVRTRTAGMVEVYLWRPSDVDEVMAVLR